MSNIIAGIDITKWATAPHHEKLVASVYDKIKGTLGNSSDMEKDINNYIQGNSTGSPVTGSMVLSTSTKYNVDPALIMAIAEVDSHYGTAGKAARTMNPGNWGNDDAGNMAFMKSWDEGIDKIGWQLNRYRGTGEYVKQGAAPYNPVPQYKETILPIYKKDNPIPEQPKTITPELVDLSPEFFSEPVAKPAVTPKVENPFSQILSNLNNKPSSGFITTNFISKRKSGGIIDEDEAMPHNQYAPASIAVPSAGEGDKLKKPKTKVGKAPVDMDLVKARQGYRESLFLDKFVKGKNDKGAIGIAQIKQETLNEYPELKKFNLRDPKQGVKAQGIIMSDLLSRPWASRPQQPDSIDVAKALGAYNMGATGLVNYLNQQKAKGVDIYNSWDWVPGLNGETRNYINEILRKKNPEFEKNFKEAAKKSPYMKYYQGGGKVKQFLDKIFKSDIYNSPIATGLKIIDPTGISSYGDVYNAWTDGKVDYQDIIEPLGALPVIGKAGKFFKLGKFAELDKAKKIIGSFRYDDFVKAGGRTLKRSFHRSSPYSAKEINEASKLLRDNKILSSVQYGVRGLGDIDDLLDVTNAAANVVPKKKGGGVAETPNTWINNWLSQRKDVLKSNLSDSSLKNYINNNPSAIEDRLKLYNTKIALTPESINPNRDWRPLDSAATITSGGKSRIEYPEKPLPESRVHEKIHASGIIPDVASAIRNITGITKPNVDVQAPDELYPRLMELRFKQGLDPNKQYSPDEVEQFRKDNSAGKPNALFDYFDNDKISKLLNGIAQNKIKTNNINS